MNGLPGILLNGLKQILWALLLIFVILAVCGYLFGQYIGFQNAFLVCSVIALLIAVTFTVIFTGDAIRIIREWKSDRADPKIK